MENFTSRSPVHTEPRSEVTNDLLAMVLQVLGFCLGSWGTRLHITHDNFSLQLSLITCTCQWLQQENQRVNLSLQNDIDLGKEWSRLGRISVQMHWKNRQQGVCLPRKIVTQEGAIHQLFHALYQNYHGFEELKSNTLWLKIHKAPIARFIILLSHGLLINYHSCDHLFREAISQPKHIMV